MKLSAGMYMDSYAQQFDEHFNLAIKLILLSFCDLQEGENNCLDGCTVRIGPFTLTFILVTLC